jgi:hypothetical protein
MSGMAMREEAAVRIDREFAAKLDATAFDKTPTFALGAKAQIFEFDYHHRREAVV